MKLTIKVLIFSLCVCKIVQVWGQKLPLVINTWGGVFTTATQAAWQKAQDPTANAIDVVQAGCQKCQENQCDTTVGWGGSPDENGETTLDASLMDGNTHNVGGVTGLRRIKDAIGVARKVLDNTAHSILCGDQATQFAISMGFTQELLTSEESATKWIKWRENNCQPNYWRNTPGSNSSCGPYGPNNDGFMESWNVGLSSQKKIHESPVSSQNHDTISVIAVLASGHIAAGSTTNGLSHKIPGRVSDSAIPGAGNYADSEIGGCGATGDGDIMLRFSPCFRAVTYLKTLKVTPSKAAEIALFDIARFFPDYLGALVVTDKSGNYGGAAYGWNATFAVRSPETNGVQVFTLYDIKK